MDKKNTILGTLFVIAAVASMWWASKQSKPPVPSPAVAAEATAPAGAVSTASAPPPGGAAASPAPADTDFDVVVPDPADSKYATLENSYIQVRLIDFGGAISSVAMKATGKSGRLIYPATDKDRADPAILNEQHVEPMLSINGLPHLDRNTRFQLVSQSPTAVVYRATLAGAWEVTRSYTLAPDQVGQTDPYQLRCETAFRNLSPQASAPRPAQLSLGTMKPVGRDDFGSQIASVELNGSSLTFVLRSRLEPSRGFLGSGLGAHGPLPTATSAGAFAWAGIKNQFFSAIYTPDQPGSGLATRRVLVDPSLPDTEVNAYGLTGLAAFTVPAVPPGGVYRMGGQLYVGPNEYRRLSNVDVFKDGQDGIIQFGPSFAAWAGKLLLTLMTAVHRWVPSWGLTIILTTLTLRLAFTPLTLMAARSARRMQKIAPLMNALKEKYKDNPQKLQQATIELYKEHKVNPVGGCIPMILPIPFFIGFFYMLMSSSELRFAPFLWVGDLSAPDTLFTLHHLPLIQDFPIRILPLIFVGFNFLQMQITPQPTATQGQASMMKVMPFITLLIYYRYASALSLYSTTNALIAIVMQQYVNSRKDDGDPANKKVKNVTPKRK